MPVEQFTGRQKAAILCLALGAENAAQITQKLSNDEAEIISYEIARLERLDPATAELVLVEWVESILASTALSSGGVDYAREILEKAFAPQKASSILKRVIGQLADTEGLQRLRNVDGQQLATMFRNEYPQTTALVLAHLAAPQAAAVLKAFDPPVAADLIVRIARMEKVSPDMLLLIDKSIGTDSALEFQRGMATAGGPASVAAMLNLMQASAERQILDIVSQADGTLAEQIKNLMFTFEDMRGLDDRSLQRVLRDVETKSLALALKGASAELRNRVLSQMSQRASRALNEEMEMLGPTRVRDVEAAQANIIAAIRALEESGEVVLGGGGDDALMV
ncbi:MAG: flagellar motor switch protein FliG [Gemmatimonadaceae bacterium]|nr:flagellar motor switch protein FliG [Gemmatimonadaceae bacterium]